MQTKLFPSPLAKDALPTAARLLRKGGLVVFPTETVYGLGANALSEEAVHKIFLAKGRPQDNPLIVHIADMSMLPLVTCNLPPEAEKLFATFSPGPLTVICPKHPSLPQNVTAGLPTVGIRIPSHPLAQALIRQASVPIAAPSANRSGRPSPTTFAMAVNEMNGRVDAILDGGECNHGLESTVVAIQEGSIVILRPGAITEEMLQEAGFSVSRHPTSHNRPIAPGMKYTHYKPHCDVYLTRDFPLEAISRRFPNTPVALIGITVPSSSYLTIQFDNLTAYARQLYATFAKLESQNIAVIIAQAVEPKGIGKALMNRLQKASGNQWIEDMA